MLRTYKLFISHAWHRDEEYWRVVQMLNEGSYFHWENLSVPEHDPIDTSNAGQLEYTLRGQIRECCAFIAVPPWGQVLLPAAIAPYADKIASRQDTLIQAVRDHALPEGA
jgi:hypothetical protein